MKRRQNLWLTLSIFALTSSALAGSFDRPTPLIPNDAPNSQNEEVFEMFHFFMPENGLPPHARRRFRPCYLAPRHIPAGVPHYRRDKQ